MNKKQHRKKNDKQKTNTIQGHDPAIKLNINSIGLALNPLLFLVIKSERYDKISIDIYIYMLASICVMRQFVN